MVFLGILGIAQFSQGLYSCRLPQKNGIALKLLTEFVRKTGARWLWPLLGAVLLAEAGVTWLAVRNADAAVFSVVVGSVGLLGTLALVGGLIEVAQHTERKRQALLDQTQAQAQAADRMLHEAIDIMPAGFAIYDAQDRLIMCNKQVWDILPHADNEVVMGKTYAQLIRRAIELGIAPAPAGHEEEWFTQRLAERGTTTGPVLRAAQHGRWLHHYEQRTPSGHLVTVRLDVTELVNKSMALEGANAQLARLSTTDGLTGIGNRRLFDQTLQSEWQRSARGQQPVSLLMVDVDFFKRYNDRYGHLAGDECLRRVARILESCVKRSGELVARYGGEEFALLLPGTDAAEAQTVAQHCADEMAKARIPHPDSLASPWVTVSIGVATAMASPEVLPETLVAHADIALYRAKDAGRARFELTREPTREI